MDTLTFFPPSQSVGQAGGSDPFFRKGRVNNSSEWAGGEVGDL